MDLRRLEMFLRVVDSGSVTAAARVLHLTQPALTRNLKQLEEDLDVALFERRGRGLALTAAGRALEPRARALLGEAARVVRAVARHAKQAFFDVRIGTVDSVAMGLLPAALADLRAAFPELAVKLRTGRTADLLREIAAGALDLAVVAWQGPPAGARHRLQAYEPRWSGRADRFPELASITTFEALQRYPLVQIEPAPGQPTMIAEDATTFAVTGSVASVKALVLAGFGVGALPAFLLSPDEAAQLVAANVPHDPDCALYLVAAPTWDRPAERAIADRLADALR